MVTITLTKVRLHYMKHFTSLLLLLVFSSCYKAPKIEGFSGNTWNESLENCDDYRIAKSKEVLIGGNSQILTINQNELKELLGTPDQHQLFNRNQKFFFYNLDCDSTARLSVRFDALGRVKEVTIEQTQ